MSLVATPRSEAEIMGDTVVRLIEVGLIGGDLPSVIRRAADALGVPVSVIRESWKRLERTGWRTPSTRTECRNDGCTNLATEDALYCSRACQAAAWKNGSRPTEAETSRVAEQASRKTERYQAAHPEPGKRRCARCRQVFDEDQFPTKNAATGRRRSYCRSCWKKIQQERYLSVGKAQALNEARLEFVVVAGDLVDLACTDCGLPLRPGDNVHGQTTLAHVDCQDAQAAVPEKIPDFGLSLLAALSGLGGEVFNPSGRATAELLAAHPVDVTKARVAQVMRFLADAGYLRRSMKGRLVTRIALTAKGLEALDARGSS